MSEPERDPPQERVWIDEDWDQQPTKEQCEDLLRRIQAGEIRGYNVNAALEKLWALRAQRTGEEGR